MEPLSEKGRRFAIEALGRLRPEIDAKTIEFRPLAGDASDRSYIRAIADQTSAILMSMAGAVGSTEVGASDAPGRFPFGEIARFLLEAGLPAPRILAERLESGWVLLEDLGNETLFDAMNAGRLTTQRIESLYGEAIEMMAAFQRLSQRSGFPGTPIAQRRYEAALLDWEFDHYLEWALEKGPHPPYDPEAIENLRGALKDSTSSILALPNAPTHRDFHAKNLMLDSEDRLGLIDFQDALMGPPAYDLASLLGDAYWEVPMDLQSKLIDRFFGSLDPQPDRALFKASLEANLLQRQLKAVGRFYYLDRVKGKPGYLPFIPSLLRRIRDRLDRTPMGERLARAGAYRPLSDG